VKKILLKILLITSLLFPLYLSTTLNNYFYQLLKTDYVILKIFDENFFDIFEKILLTFDFKTQPKTKENFFKKTDVGLPIIKLPEETKDWEDFSDESCGSYYKPKKFIIKLACLIKFYLVFSALIVNLSRFSLVN